MNGDYMILSSRQQIISTKELVELTYFTMQCNILEQSWPIIANMQNLLGSVISLIMTTTKSIVIVLQGLICFFSIYSSLKCSITSLVIQNSIKDGVVSAIPLDLLMLVHLGEKEKVQRKL